ncbi:MAG: hypothetical protein U1A27_08305 [Phycisphaerae bacterium]
MAAAEQAGKGEGVPGGLTAGVEVAADLVSQDAVELVGLGDQARGTTRLTMVKSLRVATLLFAIWAAKRERDEEMIGGEAELGRQRLERANHALGKPAGVPSGAGGGELARRVADALDRGRIKRAMEHERLDGGGLAVGANARGRVARQAEEPDEAAGGGTDSAARPVARVAVGRNGGQRYGRRAGVGIDGAVADELLAAGQVHEIVRIAESDAVARVVDAEQQDAQVRRAVAIGQVVERGGDERGLDGGRVGGGAKIVEGDDRRGGVVGVSVGGEPVRPRQQAREAETRQEQAVAAERGRGGAGEAVGVERAGDVDPQDDRMAGQAALAHELVAGEEEAIVGCESDSLRHAIDPAEDSASVCDATRHRKAARGGDGGHEMDTSLWAE